MVLPVHFISDFGDSAVAGTLSVVLAMVFFVARNRNAALAMLLAFGGAGALIAIAKIMFYGCHVDAPATGLHSPSGHAAISAAVYGTFTLIAAARLRARHRLPAYILTAIFVATIAVTRVMLGYHSPVEVLFGLAVGTGTCFIVWLTCLRGRPPVVNHVLFVTMALAIILLLHGIRLPAEAVIDKIAALLAIACVR